jgi:glycosyltransferase involved in cell wall biosynthesis
LSNPLLSIIIPAYNEEIRLPNTLAQVTSFLNTQAYPAEVLVVENGSRDRTLEIARDFSRRFSYVKALHVDGRGKGLAVKYGMQQATGDYRFICDADLSMPIKEVNCFIPPILPVMDIAIASREAPGAVRYNEPLYRHLTGRFFNLVVRLLALPGLQDTQCGFKCFRGAVADEIFPLQTINGWSFDVEVLFIARQRGYKIVEIPVPWYFSAESKVRIFHDLYKVGLDLIAIRRNAWNGKYKT